MTELAIISELSYHTILGGDSVFAQCIRLIILFGLHAVRISVITFSTTNTDYGGDVSLNVSPISQFLEIIHRSRFPFIEMYNRCYFNRRNFCHIENNSRIARMVQ